MKKFKANNDVVKLIGDSVKRIKNVTGEKGEKYKFKLSET